MPTPDIPPLPTMIADESIGTRQLVNQAVTIGKTDEPMQIATITAKAWTNEALDTSLTEIVTVDIPVPSWAGVCYVYASARWQWSNTSGGNQGCYIVLDLNDVISNDSSTAEMGLTNQFTGTMTPVLSLAVTSPGSTVTVRLRAKVNSGTNASNNTYLAVLGLVTR